MAAQQRRRAHGQCLSKPLAEAWVWFARAGKALSGQVSPPGPGQDLRWVSLEGCRSAPLHLAAQGAQAVAETVQAMALGYRAGARVCRTWSGPPGCSSHKKPHTLAPFHGRAGQPACPAALPNVLSISRGRRLCSGLRSGYSLEPSFSTTLPRDCSIRPGQKAASRAILEWQGPL
jgi:hypothetical protein